MQGGPGSGKRPYAESDADFQKEKVRGKMQSGAITALSHFRGQGAKGDAPKEYINMVKRSDQEAASSLELDHVPADQRQVVKEYFSSLKRDFRSAPPPPRNAPGPAEKTGTGTGGAQPDEGELLRE